ncbi:purple acid phosphatase family protein [Streptomyces thermolineatus]|uniref:purple acid phosphatase family protein n=1 Tax=Streptomyces thermolineatus TaxID=44033 RepID=UPI003850BBF6
MDTPRMGIDERLAARMSMPEQHEYLRARLSRRGVLRRGAAAAGVAAGAGLLGGSAVHAAPGAPRSGPVLLSSPATGRVDGSLVAPFGRHLALGADPRTQMRVAWQVPFAVRGPFLRLGTEPWDLGRRIPAEVRHLQTPSLSRRLPAVDQYYLHVALDGLRPGTTYYYGVGHEGFDPAGARVPAAVGSFTTAPARAGRFVFTAFGDQGVSYHALANDALILAQGPAFHLHAGDICYADGSGLGKESDTYDARTWDQFLAQTEPVASRVPWMVTTGNHDMEAWYSPDGYDGQRARFALPGNGPDAVPGAYSFTYGNVGVVALDSNDVSHEIPANRGLSRGRQTAWLERRLRGLRATAGIDFVVVFFHHCAYSTTSAHASDGGVRKEWTHLFDTYAVDLVVNGHNHVYERTDAIRGGEVSLPLPVGATVRPERDGTVYVTAGGAGKELYGFAVPDSHEGKVEDLDHVATYRWTESRVPAPEVVRWSRVRYTGYSFLAVEVEPAPAGGTATLTVSALAEDGRRIDRFTVARKAGSGTGGRSGSGAG